MWSQSPLRSWDPHVFLIVMGAIIIAAISYFSYFRMKARAEEKRLGADKEESAFKNLMAKQKAIMDKILELEENFGDGNMSEEDYQAKLAAYKQHLVQVKMNLRQFVE
jgi:mannitol-1-phosphate/altronate dehydrogenase